jgi:hypothetical protein
MMMGRLIVAHVRLLCLYVTMCQLIYILYTRWGIIASGNPVEIHNVLARKLCGERNDTQLWLEKYVVR